MEAASMKRTIELQSKNIKTVDDIPALEKFGATGLIKPLMYEDRVNSVSILPFQSIPKTTQITLCSALLQEWKSTIDCLDIEQVKEYIEKNWQAGDIFYALAFGSQFIGCVAIDRKNFYPYLTHLYISPSHRGNGYAALLIKFTEIVLIQQQDRDVRLNCAKSLKSFYEGHGFQIEKITDETLIMKKDLVSTRHTFDNVSSAYESASFSDSFSFAPSSWF